MRLGNHPVTKRVNSMTCEEDEKNTRWKKNALEIVDDRTEYLGHGVGAVGISVGRFRWKLPTASGCAPPREEDEEEAAAWWMMMSTLSFVSCISTESYQKLVGPFCCCCCCCCCGLGGGFLAFLFDFSSPRPGQRLLNLIELSPIYCVSCSFIIVYYLCTFILWENVAIYYFISFFLSKSRSLDVSGFFVLTDFYRSSRER